MLDKESKVFLSKYEKYKLSIENIDKHNESINWAEKPRFTLILIGDSNEYDTYLIKNACELKERIDECEFKDDAEIYLFPQAKRLKIETVKNYFQNRYKIYYNNLHTDSFLKNINLINSLSLLTVISVLVIISLKYQWIDLGLPLESLPGGGVFEDYLNILALLIFELFVKELFASSFIFFLLIVLFLLSEWITNKYKYPSKKIYPYYFFKTIFLSFFGSLVGSIIVFFLIVIFEHVFMKKNNFILEAILSSTIYPKVTEYDGRIHLISHMDGKYAYVHDINGSIRDNNCSKVQPFIKSLNTKPQNFTAVKYDELDVSSIESVKEFCKRNNKNDGE